MNLATNQNCPGSAKLVSPVSDFRAGFSRRHAPNQTVACPHCKSTFTLSARKSSYVPEHKAAS